MKLYGLLVYNESHKLIYSNYNLADFLFLYRSTIKDNIEIIASELVKRNDGKNLYKINESRNGIDLTIYCSTYDKFYIIITNPEYPQTTAFELIKSLRGLDEFNSEEVDKLFVSYQKPLEVDKVLRVKTELDETKLVMMDSINKLLDRGERIEDLIDKTNQLSENSSVFKVKARELNSCCIIL